MILGAANKTDSQSSAPMTVVQSGRDSFLLGLVETWRYRQLLYFFIWRDSQSRQTLDPSIQLADRLPVAGLFLRLVEIATFGQVIDQPPVGSPLLKS